MIEHNHSAGSEHCPVCGPDEIPGPSKADRLAHKFRCKAPGPHQHGDVCDGGRVQSPNAQFTRRCEVCAGTGLDARALLTALASAAADRGRVEELAAVLEGYERWEANLVLHGNWLGAGGMPAGCRR